MVKKRRDRGAWMRRVLVFSAILLSLSGCFLLNPGKPSDTLRYNLPTAIQVNVGKALPGTPIIYEGRAENGANVLVNGQRALKRSGDSLFWKGSLAEGVAADIRVRLVWFNDEAMYVAGTTQLDIAQTRPTPGPIISTSPVKFGGVVSYRVRRGEAIPGSTITYEEKMPDQARLGGIADYPYRKAGDSIFWEGTLREGVYIRVDLRLVQYDTNSMRVGGLVTLWIGS